MNIEQLKEIQETASIVETTSYNAWYFSLPGGDEKYSKKQFASFEQYLKELNALVERFHMDNENEVTSERVQP